MSDQSAKPTIFEVFAEVKRQVGPVGKNRRNTQQNFNFRGVDDVVNAAAGALDEHGVITVPILQEITYTTVEVGQKRTQMAHVRVKVNYRFHGPAGDHFDAIVPGEAMDSGDKGTAKAMSVAYRIALLQALNLPTTDEDPDTKSYERSPRESFDSARPAHSRSAAETFDDARPAPGPQTDQVWADDINRQIEAIASRADGERLFNEIVAARNDRKCTPADYDQLKGLIGAKVQAVLNEQANQQAPNAPAASGAEPTGQANGQSAETAETAWVRAFTERLADSRNSADFTARRGEIARAVAAHEITPETANDLSNEVSRVKNGERKANAA